eukprot:TRINITY_DN59201_c0_g1_i2.p1 TRINITY_DN59201_c0_g1~~TRINITY_DN59201_c0_g1_i2.p1  ORF type:complete len:1434 (+),score=394.01 TRINITY_DN59201_c0_g1_i2:52-4353(+)
MASGFVEDGSLSSRRLPSVATSSGGVASEIEPWHSPPKASFAQARLHDARPNPHRAHALPKVSLRAEMSHTRNPPFAPLQKYPTKSGWTATLHSKPQVGEISANLASPRRFGQGVATRKDLLHRLRDDDGPSSLQTTSKMFRSMSLDKPTTAPAQSDHVLDLTGFLAKPGTADALALQHPGTGAADIDRAFDADAMSRLATPRKRGLGAAEKAIKRSMHQEYEAYAQKTVQEMIPEGAPVARSENVMCFGDVWHSAGEDGYRSAVFHAAVRCKELLQSTGLPFEIIEGQTPNAPGHVVFSGATSGPELTRLHTACFLFQNLCEVSSPLQDTLRFLLRELCHCIFDSFCLGSDILMLTPFFSCVYHTRQEMAAERERASVAEQMREKAEQQVQKAESNVNQLRAQLEKERESSRQMVESFERLTAERNTLRERLAINEERSAIREDELRVLSGDLARCEASLFQTRQEADRAKQEATAANKELKESQAVNVALEKKLADLQAALDLVAAPGPGGSTAERQQARRGNSVEVGDTPSAKSAGAFPSSSGVEHLGADLERAVESELAHIRREAEKRSVPQALQFSTEKDQRGAAIDAKRLLKVMRPDGTPQLILKGSTDDERGLVFLANQGGGNAADTSAGRNKLPMIVSPEVFAALSICNALPRPPDLLSGASSQQSHNHSLLTDEGIVRMVMDEVRVLAEEHTLLLQLFRELRRKLKETLKLIPEWNADELRGVLRNVVKLDREEALLVPLPVVKSKSIVGLGEGEQVPEFLQYTGNLKLTGMKQAEVIRVTEELWHARTVATLTIQAKCLPWMNLTEFFGSIYLPARGKAKQPRMEFSYNFLHSLRLQTTLAAEEELHEDVSMNSVPDNSPVKPTTPRDGGEAASQQAVVARGNTKFFQPNVDFHPGAELWYRGLLGELHEDAFHDQTAMLAALVSTLVMLCERLQPAFALPPPPAADTKEKPASEEKKDKPDDEKNAKAGDMPRDDEGSAEHKPIVYGFAELSAILRLFFPAKPREHLSSLKNILLTYGKLQEMEEFNAQSKKAAGERAESKTPNKPGGQGAAAKSKAAPPKSPAHRPTLQQLRSSVLTASPSMKKGEAVGGKPKVIDIGRALGVTLVEGRSVEKDNLLNELIGRPSPLALELRRQHLCEAFRVIVHKTGQTEGEAAGASGAGGGECSAVSYINVRQAEAALSAADAQLTETQRRIYILRGFGQRLPDASTIMPPSEGPLKSKADVQKLLTKSLPSLCPSLGLPDTARRGSLTTGTSQSFESMPSDIWKGTDRLRALLKDRVQLLVEQGITVPRDVFVRRLAATGVAKYARMWQPAIAIGDVVRESGLDAVRGCTAGGALEEFCTAPSATSLTSLAQAAAAPSTFASRDLQDADLTQQHSADDGEEGTALARYREHLKVSQGVVELSVGYPLLALQCWLSLPL